MRYILFATLIFLPGFVFAHATGTSLEQRSGGYLVDVGYSPEELMAKTPFALDFTLVNSNTKEEVSFTDIWVQVKDQTRTVFATSLHKARFGKTNLLYTFPEPGQYDVSLRFQENNETLAEALFPLVVGGREDISSAAKSTTPFVFLALGLIVGFAGAFLLQRKNNEA